MFSVNFGSTHDKEGKVFWKIQCNVKVWIGTYIDQTYIMTGLKSILGVMEMHLNADCDCPFLLVAVTEKTDIL